MTIYPRLNQKSVNMINSANRCTLGCVLYLEHFLFDLPIPCEISVSGRCSKQAAKVYITTPGSLPLLYATEKMERMGSNIRKGQRESYVPHESQEDEENRKIQEERFRTSLSILSTPCCALANCKYIKISYPML